MKNFEKCKSVVFRVEAKPMWGASINNALKECIDFAKATKCEVHMNFNDVDLWIRDYHTVEAQKRCYDEEIKRACKS